VINNLTEIKDRSSTTQASVHLRQPHIYQHLSTQRSTCRISFIISVRLNQDGSNPWSSTSSFNESLIHIQVSDAEAVIISVRLNDRLRSTHLDEPFFSLPNKKYSATYHKQPNTNKRPIKKYHLHIVTSFISLQCFEHIYFLLQSIIPFLNFGLELQ
jgi:hypothetical protein